MAANGAFENELALALILVGGVRSPEAAEPADRGMIRSVEQPESGVIRRSPLVARAGLMAAHACGTHPGFQAYLIKKPLRCRKAFMCGRIARPMKSAICRDQVSSLRLLLRVV